MGISRFPIRPEVDLRNINSASLRGAIFSSTGNVALPVPDKGRYAPPVHMIKLTATLLARSAFQRGLALPDWRVSRQTQGSILRQNVNLAKFPLNLLYMLGAARVVIAVVPARYSGPATFIWHDRN
jgi:hypothetical protein